MAVHHEKIFLQAGVRPEFVDITDRLLNVVEHSGIRDGIAVVYSPHTTCSILIQEDSHDVTYHGTKYLLQDLLNALETLAPRCEHEGSYLHPGPDHIDHALENLGEEEAWSLNTDAHLRSSLLGRSESIPIVEGALQLGDFGCVYFADLDGVRARKRTVQVQIVGE
jgi:secondary thiamine-phosphate synthase enzyme